MQVKLSRWHQYISASSTKLNDGTLQSIDWGPRSLQVIYQYRRFVRSNFGAAHVIYYTCKLCCWFINVVTVLVSMSSASVIGASWHNVMERCNQNVPCMFIRILFVVFCYFLVFSRRQLVRCRRLSHFDLLLVSLFSLVKLRNVFGCAKLSKGKNTQNIHFWLIAL